MVKQCTSSLCTCTKLILTLELQVVKHKSSKSLKLAHTYAQDCNYEFVGYAYISELM